jgi:hypothetical protein
MSTLEEILASQIDLTIDGLKRKRFTPDPISGKYYSKIASLISSACKRHGFILERALVEQLKTCPRFEVWEDKVFHVTTTAEHIVDTIFGTPDRAIQTTTDYSPQSHRTLQIDAIVYDRERKTLGAYEIKRGGGLHDSGKRRSILRDLLCTQVLLKSYGTQRGFEVEEAASRVIFYYGKCSIKKPFSLTAEELDEHFGWPVREAVERLNEYYRQKLFDLLMNFSAA